MAIRHTFEIPFFIFQGEKDVLTTHPLAEKFFNDVIAPMKRMALISDAGHFAAFMKPDQFLLELLMDVRPLAELPATPSEWKCAAFGPAN